MMEDTTTIIKTILRPKAFRRTLESLLSQYPGMKVIVGDDSPEPYAPSIAAEMRSKGHHVRALRLPYDVGIGAGRNALLREVTTPLFLLLDDDHEIDAGADVRKLRRCVREGEFDIAGGKYITHRDDRVESRHWAGHFHYEATTGNLRGELVSEREPWTPVECVSNFFVARVAPVLAMGGWDERLKVEEHVDFFLTANKAGLRVAFVQGVTLRHYPIRQGPYKSLRLDRRHVYTKLWQSKWGVRDWRDFWS